MPFGFFDKSSLAPALEARLKAWQALEPPALQLAHYQVRYLVLELGGQGERQTLAALGVSRGRISGQDAFWLDLATAGAEQWLAWLEFMGKSPLVCHQAPLVGGLLEPLLKQALGLEFKPVWLDLAQLLPELFRDARIQGVRQDAWLRHFELELPQPGDSMAGVLAQARLLQRLLAAAKARGVDNPGALLDLARARRWLHGDA